MMECAREATFCDWSLPLFSLTWLFSWFSLLFVPLYRSDSFFETPSLPWIHAHSLLAQSCSGSRGCSELYLVSVVHTQEREREREGREKKTGKRKKKQSSLPEDVDRRKGRSERTERVRVETSALSYVIDQIIERLDVGDGGRRRNLHRCRFVCLAKVWCQSRFRCCYS